MTVVALWLSASFTAAAPPNSWWPHAFTWAHDHPAPHQPEHRPLDYVIIGGGVSGLVIAEQLSRDPSINIIVLEAGPDGTDEPLINTPAYTAQLEVASGTRYIWNFTSQPDPNIAGLKPPLAQGHAWGGGSAVNYMQYCRGAPSVFDEWAEVSGGGGGGGNDGLRWKSLLHDYNATAHYKEVPLGYDPAVNSSAYGHGPLEVTVAEDTQGFALRLVDAMKETLELPEVDLNDGDGIGVTTGPKTIRASNRTRDYALEAFGWQMFNRLNVQMIHNAWVSKIGFSGKKATNVTYHSNDSVNTLHAKEIILAAGAINSPKLLMLSGIGPASHLQDLSIPVVADMPSVGQNLYDHHFAVLEYQVTQSVETAFQLTQNSTFRRFAEEEYSRNGSGPLGVLGSLPFAVARAPDRIFEAVKDTFHPSLPADRGQLLYQATSGSLLSTLPNVSLISAFVALVQPEASGYLLLNSSDYRDDPLIYSNYFGSPGDKAAILYGYKTLRRIMANRHTADVIVKEVFPGANITSDEDLWRAIQQSARSFHHVLGSVALGKVLDQNWRVKGLEGLRVVDSSTFPSPPTCHLQATVYAYVHHVAGVIRKEDGGKRRGGWWAGWE